MTAVTLTSFSQQSTCTSPTCSDGLRIYVFQHRIPSRCMEVPHFIYPFTQQRTSLLPLTFPNMSKAIINISVLLSCRQRFSDPLSKQDEKKGQKRIVGKVQKLSDYRTTCTKPFSIPDNGYELLLFQIITGKSVIDFGHLNV